MSPCPPAERENYVETHRCSILKNSLSPDILSTITRKEQIFRAFSSQEILDHVISAYHVRSLADETEQYQVFYASKNPPVAAQIRSLEQRDVKRKTKTSVTADRTKKSPDDPKFTRGNRTHYGRGQFQNRQRDSKPSEDRTRLNNEFHGTPTNGQSEVVGNLDNVRFPSHIPAGICVKCLSANHETKSCHSYGNRAISKYTCRINGRNHGVPSLNTVY